MQQTTQLPAVQLQMPPVGRISLTVRLATILAIAIPFLGVVAAPFFLWGWGFRWTDLGLLLGMYILSILGIGVGLHRLFVHRSYQTYTWVKFILAAIGGMAVQGSLMDWVAIHRRHHQFSDTPDDPHSPRHGGVGFLGALRGYWHAHIGWFFKPDAPGLHHYVKDLKASPALRWASRLFPVWVLLGLVIPAALGGVITQSWLGVWTGLIWGGLIRIFIVHHVTWSVNSACHLWGNRPFHSQDESRNNLLFGILALGEGWHNSHHAFPTSARHGLRWWQIDVNYYAIRTLVFLGLAWNLKLPTADEQAKLRSALKQIARA